MGIWLRWVIANLVGEAAGLGLGLSVGFALALPFGESQGALLVLGTLFGLAVVGAIEGLAVGPARHWVLGRVLPSLGGVLWVSATVAGGIVAWCIGISATVAALAGLALLWRLRGTPTGYADRGQPTRPKS